MTQLASARQNKLTKEIELVAKAENLDATWLRDRIAKGKIALPFNPRHSPSHPCAIGKGTRTKVNANIGSSPDFPQVENELKKLKAAIAAKTDTIMDLSTGGDINLIRETIINHSPVPVGTVPIYGAAVNARQSKRAIVELSEDELFNEVIHQAEQGVDFMTIHCGVTWRTLNVMKEQGRITDVVSRGGAFTLEWMIYNQKENPFYEHYDRLLEIAKKYDITLSLGDGFRPGCLADATDRAQIEELLILGELTRRAWDSGVQVIIEGPGHVPLNQIEANMLLEKQICQEAPFYVLGPLVTDVAPGYDHITAAIGGALAAMTGADFLCYVTKSEHLRLPTVDEVYEGVIVTRIAAHAADIAKGLPGALDWDIAMAKARKSLDWEKMLEYAIDPKRARQMRLESPPTESDVCTICGEFCAMKGMTEYLKKVK
ncbi:MAG: phosphomethylpyrimidine synthase ThiC [bacterium]|nr:phosphomethylpyrimidine synthase ThiC [bacterium]